MYPRPVVTKTANMVLATPITIPKINRSWLVSTPNFSFHELSIGFIDGRRSFFVERSSLTGLKLLGPLSELLFMSNNKERSEITGNMQIDRKRIVRSLKIIGHDC